MARTFRFRIVCRTLAGLLLMLALTRLVLSVTLMVDPLWAPPSPGCEQCSSTKDPVRLLEPEVARKAAWQTPGTDSRIVQELGRSEVRLMLAGAHLVRVLPFIAVLLCLALALRSFAAAGLNRHAVRWLRRSAFASVLWALAHPVSQSLHWTAFSRITHGEELGHLVLDLNYVLWPVLLSCAVWVCTWALGEAVALRQDLEEYV